MNEWMTATEVAAYLRCSVAHVRRELRAGEMRSVQLGRSYRIRRQWADSYLEKRAV